MVTQFPKFMTAISKILVLATLVAASLTNADESKSFLDAIAATRDARDTLIKDLQEEDQGKFRSEFAGCPDREQYAQILEDQKRYDPAVKVWLQQMYPPDGVTSKAFFGGVHLGMTIDDCVNRYGVPMGHSGAPEGQEFVELRHNLVLEPGMQWRILVNYRKSDHKIVSVTYWKVGEPHTFSAEEKRYLVGLNSKRGPVVTHVYDDGELDVTQVSVP
jgi:hypothetical protein